MVFAPHRKVRAERPTPDRPGGAVGDRAKIRLLNEMADDHPMHHPFHLHGGGRFLVVARDGVEEPNLMWKDTVLLRTGEPVDILLEVTNPGRGMAHWSTTRAG
jgi:FtsP/CotA-like multicopper oxidase with cupredoxin domain